MQNKVYPISGNKISSLHIDENSLNFSSANFDSVEAFQEAWKKKLSLSTKVEVKYEAIKSIKKEENDKEILIKYKTLVGIPLDCEFSFDNEEDYETFFNYMVKERYFSRTQETLSPIKAVMNYVLGLVLTIAITAFSYFQAIEIANGTADEGHNGKARLFNKLVGVLGDKGVIAIGALISAFLIYKIWKRYSNPPNLIQLLPPNG